METEKIFNWLMEHAPETADRILSWGFIWSFTGAAFSLAGMLVFGILAFRCYRRGKNADTASSTGDWYIGSAVLVLCKLGCIAGFVASVYWMIMVECFPRLYLLSYLKDFVR